MKKPRIFGIPEKNNAIADDSDDMSALLHSVICDCMNSPVFWIDTAVGAILRSLVAGSNGRTKQATRRATASGRPGVAAEV